MAEAVKTKKIFDGRYEILSIVGRGARSVVYHARHAMTPSSEVALKVLLEKEGGGSSAERLRREALAMVSSRHKFVVRLDDFHSVGTLCYLSMEFAPERDLRTYCQKMGGKLNHDQAERYLRQCAEALSAVHKAGIVHRDVKPDNILVVNEKEIRLTDFGVALLPGEESSLADLQSGIGTMNYMAPEILEGKQADQRSDIYSLGVVFYEVITGTNPFDKVPLAQQVEARRDDKIPGMDDLVADVPDYLAATLRRAISFKAEDRFASARDLVQALLAHKAPPIKEIRGRKRLHQRPPASGSQQEILPETIHENSLQAQQAEAATSQATTPLTKPSPADATVAYQHPIVSATSVAPKEDISRVSFEETIAIDRSAVERLKAKNTMPLEAGHKSRAWRVPAIVAALVIGLIVAVVPGLDGDQHGLKNGGPDTSEAASMQSPIPAFSGEAFQFPAFAAGMYTGSLSNFTPGREVPIAIISFAQRDELVVLVGIDGWTPVVVKPRQLLANADSAPTERRMRVASNGVIIDFTGQNIDGEVFGYFSDLVRKTQGEWRVRPVRPPSESQVSQ